MNHAQFKELLFNLLGEFCDKQIKFKGVSDFLDGNYNGKKELLQYLLDEYNKVPDIATELESFVGVEFCKASKTYDLTKDADSKNHMDAFKIVYDKIKELQNGN